jgi:hypothetical protein
VFLMFAIDTSFIYIHMVSADALWELNTRHP